MCDFPARELLEMAERVTTETDPNDAVKLVYACGFVKAVGDAAAFHEDLTGCRCWEEEIVNMGWLDQPRWNDMR